MFNRTLLTMSANLDRLNLGTRSLAGMAGANVGANLRFRTSYPHVRTDALRLGSIDDLGDPAISRDPWSPAIPSSPAVSVRAVPVRVEGPRVVVVAELPPAPGEVVQPDGQPCRNEPGNQARQRGQAHRHARKWAPPKAAKAAAWAGLFARRGDDRRARFPLTDTTTTLTAPDGLTASGG
jgi:hypothetical protein